MWLKCSLLKVVRDAKNGGKMGKMGGGGEMGQNPQYPTTNMKYTFNTLTKGGLKYSLMHDMTAAVA